MQDLIQHLPLLNQPDIHKGIYLCVVWVKEKVLVDIYGDMTMNKSKMSYVTLEDGTDFRAIAQIMTDAGWTMNHATSRNVLMTSLNKLMHFISDKMGSNLTDEQIEELLKDQKVHEALAEILHQAHNS